MSTNEDPKAALKDLVAETGDPAVDAAAKVVARPSENPKGDGVTEIQEDVDFDFLAWDASDHRKFFSRLGIEEDPKMVYRWGGDSPNVQHKRHAQGWRPVPNPGGGLIRRGDVFLMQRPKVISARHKQQVRDLTALREKGPMEKFESDVQPQKESGLFETFDGPGSLREGM